MFANFSSSSPSGAWPHERGPEAWSRPSPTRSRRQGAAPQRRGSHAMQGILELGLSPASRGGNAGNPPLARRSGRKPVGAPARPLPVLGIPDATIRPFQSFAVQCPPGKRHRAIGEASHVFVELSAAGPGQGVVVKLRPAPPHALDGTIECTALYYASGIGRTFDPETQLSYYSRGRRVQPPSAMRAQFDWHQAGDILMELSSLP